MEGNPLYSATLIEEAVSIIFPPSSATVPLALTFLLPAADIAMKLLRNVVGDHVVGDGLAILLHLDGILAGSRFTEAALGTGAIARDRLFVAGAYDKTRTDQQNEDRGEYEDVLFHDSSFLSVGARCALVSELPHATAESKDSATANKD